MLDITVGELISILSKFPKDTPVRMQNITKKGYRERPKPRLVEWIVRTENNISTVEIVLL